MSVTIESVGAFFGMSRIYSMVLNLFASCNVCQILTTLFLKTAPLMSLLHKPELIHFDGILL